MPLDKIRYTFKTIKPSGMVFWYFRHKSLPKPLPLPGKPGEPGFQREYSRLLDQVSNVTKVAVQMADSNSIRWLSEQYRAADEFLQLSDKTRIDYIRELDRLCEMVGDLPFSKLTSEGVRTMRKQVKADTIVARQNAIAARAIRDYLQARDHPGKKPARRSPPIPVTSTTGSRTADYFKAVLSALMAWAVENGHASSNPAENIKRLHRGKNVDHRTPWLEHQISYVMENAPRWIVDGVVLGLYTGQRLGDCCRLTKKRCIGSDVRIRQQKTGNLVNVRAIGPLASLISRRRGANVDNDPEQLLLREDGQPYTERLFSEHLREYLDSQGWDDISFHGLRYAAAGSLNEAGCTVATICSIIGHSTYQMALQYLAEREDRQNVANSNQEAADRREGNR